MGCWNPRMAKDIEWGPRCPCCPLGHEGARASQRGAGKVNLGNLGNYWGCFVPGGSCQPSDSGCWCWSLPQSSPGFSWQQSGRRVKGRDPFANRAGLLPKCLLEDGDITSRASQGSLLSPALTQDGRRNRKKEEDGTFWKILTYWYFR